MPANRYYLEEYFAIGEEKQLTGEECHHLSRVMRRKKGSSIEIVNGKGALAQAEIIQIGRKEAKIRIEKVASSSPALFPLALVQALLPLPSLKLIVQKGTELGASHFFFFPTSQSEKKTITEATLLQLKGVAISALKQCGRLDLPSITYIDVLSPSLLPPYPLYFGDVRRKKPLLSSLSVKGPAAILIGPEKGFTVEEVEYYEKEFYAQGISLHPYILRAETAALTAITLLGSTSLTKDKRKEINLA